MPSTTLSASTSGGFRLPADAVTARSVFSEGSTITGTRPYAPRELFEQILEYMVIPTFDLVIEYGSQGVIIVRRKIAPYKGEGINDALVRIAREEVGLEIKVSRKRVLGQYVGKFRSEHQRQDLSTGYIVRATDTQPITINTRHFSSFRLTRSIPNYTGAMYRHYLSRYLKPEG